MDDAFDMSAAPAEASIVFRHDEADARLGASVFWSTRSGALSGEQALVEYFQARREGGMGGIVEIIPEAS
jgi:hypothetical protein